MVEDSGREDFEEIIRNRGLDPNDFELLEERDALKKGEIHAIRGTVTIKRKSNGIEKRYRGGHGSTWPAEFDGDLNSGKFE